MSYNGIQDLLDYNLHQISHERTKKQGNQCLEKSRQDRCQIAIFLREVNEEASKLIKIQSDQKLSEIKDML